MVKKSLVGFCAFVLAGGIGLNPAHAGTLGGEPPDFNFGTNVPTFTAVLGAGTVTGTLGPTPNDGQDLFNVDIPSSLQVTSVSYSGPGGPHNLVGCGLSGTSNLNQSFNPAQSSCQLSYFINTDFATGASPWTVTINCEATASGVCGDGTVDAGEDCDGGTCCTGSCTFAPADTDCGSGATECSGQDTCNASGTCQANNSSAGTACGDAGTECINQDTCDGSGGCTDNGFVAAGTACGDGSATTCDLGDECDGAGACDDNLAADGTLCDDSDVCTTTDTCGAGVCVGGPDETGPTIDCSGINPARSADAGVCNFTMPGTGFDPTVSDNCPGTTIANDYNGGSSLAGATFDVGTTTVNWTVTDGAGATAMCSVDITITDDEEPTITCTADVESEPVGPDGANVTYDAPTANDNCSGVTAACVPASGSLFAIGDTTVTCTATDGVGNTGACPFAVTVLSPEEVIEELIDDVQMLGDTGALNGGQTNSLAQKLTAVQARLAAGRTNAGCNILNAFINSVNGMVNGGTLTASEAQPLIDSATNARAALECDSEADASAKSVRRRR